MIKQSDNMQSMGEFDPIKSMNNCYLKEVVLLFLLSGTHKYQIKEHNNNAPGMCYIINF